MCAGLLGACSGLVDPNVSYDPETDFSSYNTYAWAPTDPLQDLDATAAADVRAEIEGILAQKGFRPAEDADLTVSFTTSRLSYSRPVRARYETRPSAVFADRPPDETRQSIVSLSISFADGTTHRALWRGSTSSEMDALANRGVAVELVASILESFPPQ